MLTLPKVVTKVANETLAPYFKKIETEILACESHAKQRELLQKYRLYIEGEAQKTKNMGMRMQLRINMRALNTKFENSVESSVTAAPKETLRLSINSRLHLAETF